MNKPPPNRVCYSGKGAVFLIVWRTVLFYLALTAIIRLLGKRQVGQMEPSEFVVTILIANLASVPLENKEIPISGGLVPMGIVFVCELLISWLCLKNIRLRRLLCGKPVILIENGRLCRENLRRTRINLDELSGHLREKDVLDMSTVQYAILETNGSVTVFPYAWSQPASARDAGVEAEEQELPYTIISDGRLLRQNLAMARKSELWLQDKLHAEGCAQKDVLLMTVTEKGLVRIFRRDNTASDNQI